MSWCSCGRNSNFMRLPPPVLGENAVKPLRQRSSLFAPSGLAWDCGPFAFAPDASFRLDVGHCRNEARRLGHRDRTAWLRRQPDSNPSLPKKTLQDLQKQEKFRNAGNANARLAKDTGFQQVEQCPPASGSREIAGQEQGKSRQEQVPPISSCGPRTKPWILPRFQESR